MHASMVQFCDGDYTYLGYNVRYALMSCMCNAIVVVGVVIIFFVVERSNEAASARFVSAFVCARYQGTRNCG